MRVLHLVHVRWWNASAQYAVHLAAAQQRAGYTVEILTAVGEPPAARAKELGLTVHEVPMKTINSPALVRRIGELSSGCDVVNAHHADLQNLALLALMTQPRASRPRLIRTRVDVRDAKPSVVNRYLYNKQLDAVIVPGEDSRRRYIGGLGIDAAKVRTVYGGVDHEKFAPDAARREAVRARLGLKPGDVAFGLIGRMGAIKAPEIFIEAGALVHAKHPQAVFLLAGKPASGHTEEEYRAVARNFGDAGIRFLGFVDDVPSILNALDGGVITSVGSEAHCRVGLEMMSSGIPVVGTDIGVIPEVVKQGETGYIVRSRNAPELASALERLVLEPELRLRLGRQARAWIESGFTFAHWVRNTEAVYREHAARESHGA
jgi:glycosyltransferase involved in cell wall biosynthesis